MAFSFRGHPARPGEQDGKPARRRQGRCLSYVDLLELVPKTKTISLGFPKRLFAFMLLVTATDITVWILSALLALGIGCAKYAKWKARNQLVRELAAMDRERREKMLSRMNPEQAMEARQELMRRFNIF
jgi:hypothetical protein